MRSIMIAWKKNNVGGCSDPMTHLPQLPSCPGLDALQPIHTTATLFKQLLALQHFDDALSLAHAAHHTIGSPELLTAQEAVVASLASTAALTQLSSAQSYSASPTNIFAVPAPSVPPTAIRSTAGTSSAAAAASRDSAGSRFRAVPARGPACYGSLAAPLWNKLREMLHAAQPQQPPSAAAAAAQQQRQGYSSPASAMHTSGPGGGSSMDGDAFEGRVGASVESNGRRFSELRAAAAKAVLSVDRDMQLPQWLLDMFSVRPGWEML